MGGISWTAVAADCRVVVVFAAAYGVEEEINLLEIKFCVEIAKIVRKVIISTSAPRILLPNFLKNEVSRFIMPNARHDSRLPGRAQQNEIFER